METDIYNNINVMKRLILIAILTCSVIFHASAQERLTVSVADPEGLEQENAVTTLTSNLRQALVLNDAASDNSRFVLESQVALLSTDVTRTAPAMFVSELEISLTVKDTVSHDILSQTSFTVKGISDNEKSSVMDAVRKVKARDPKLRALINQAKQYFEEHIY